MKSYLDELDYVLRFTQVYRSEQNIYLREANCLKLQSVNMLADIREDDLVAGCMDYRYVGFSPQVGGLYTYFFHDDKFDDALEAVGDRLEPNDLTALREAKDFWMGERTAARHQKRFEALGYRMNRSFRDPGIGNADVRLAGVNVDLDELVRLGIPGLHRRIDSYAGKGGDPTFYRALHIAVDTIADGCRFYERRAKELYAQTGGKNLLEMARNLRFAAERTPRTFAEGLQLVWIYAVISDLMNYGRMDVYLGDLYAADLDAGRLTEEKGYDYLRSLYRQLIRIHKIHDARIIVGGKGRRNEKNADRLAMAIMETSRRVKDVVPQLTLRYYTGMNEAVFDKALAVNAEGTTFPIIYSDDTNIPAVMKVYGVSEKEAESYLPFGCGEYVLEGSSIGTPNNGINLLKALEVTLHNGYDRYWNMQIGGKTGVPEEFDTFEKLWNAWESQLRPVVEKAAVSEKLNYDVAAEQAGYLHISLLTHDCVERGKGVLNGGIRYCNAASEIFGIISTADSFSAIRKIVYEEKKLTLKELVSVLDADFDGHEDVRRGLLEAPKYGNDDTAADDMAVKVFDSIADMTIAAGKRVGLNRYNIVSVNNSMSAEWGQYCMASACGRRDGAPMSNGNGASIGCDKNGVTALLNSMSRFDNTKHVGVINNVRFTKQLFTGAYGKIKALLRTFYQNGGVQTNLSVIGRDDLENAKREPEKYQNLIVRIGGFSARFVELDPVIQNELLLRTTYD